MNRIFRIALFAICTTLSAPLAAQNFEAGLKVAEEGDFAKALEIWRPLAEQGDASAQVGLGILYNHGMGVAQDFAEAMRWYRLAAEQGDADAQEILGLIYSKGEGVAQDYTEALRWYRMAAEQGDANAQANLGVIYVKGWGVIKDYVSAHMWFNIASANGNEDASGFRDKIENSMTREQTAEAQTRARVCMASGYQDCN